MKFLIWLGCVIGIEATGMISSFFAGDIAATYAQLSKPPLAPPGSIVGIIWTILYALIGTALYLIIVSQVSPALKRGAIIFFAVQQILNFIWSIIFFGGNQYWLASVVIVLLIASIIACMIVFLKVDKKATYLFIPYLIWCCYAGYLCFGLAVLN